MGKRKAGKGRSCGGGAGGGGDYYDHNIFHNFDDCFLLLNPFLLQLGWRARAARASKRFR